MPYVRRDNSGSITAVSKSQTQEFSEHLPESNSELQSFIAKEFQTPSETITKLENSDYEFVRVTEDLIQLLVQKNIILFTELPPVVQGKLLNREKLRSQLQQGDNAGLLDDEGGI